MDFQKNHIPKQQELINLYNSVGWSSYTTYSHQMVPMVKNSWLVWTAYDAGQLVGLARVVSDGATIAYIQDLLVAPSHQRKSIGE